MKLAVTGGAGFIGSNFVRYWLGKHPQDDIRVIDKLTYAGSLASLGDALSDSRVKFFRLDIGEPAVAEALSGCDAAIHFAAESHVDRSIEDPAPFMRTNVEGTWRLIEFCRAGRVGRFVHVSTDEVYGSADHGESFSERAPLAPTSPYAASKAASDLLVLSAVHTYGFPAIVTRCTNNYGPFQFPEKFIPLMILRALAGEPLPIYGDGRNVRDWIHVEDHCRALDLILHRGKDGAIYNIAGGCEQQNIAVARRILGAAKKPESLLRFVLDRPAHDRRYALDCSKLKSELGWEPQWDFGSGLEETVRWYQQHRAWWQEILSGEYQQYFERHYLRREETFKAISSA